MILCRPIEEIVMKRLFLVIVLVAAGVVVLGFYRGWFGFASENVDNKVHMSVTVDKDKIQEDEKNSAKKVQDLGHQVKDKVAGPAEKTKDQDASPEQPRNPK
jgi:hypothetical protein